MNNFSKILLGILVCITAWAFTMPQQQPMYSLALTPQQAEALLYVIDKSSAEHSVVTQVQQAIIPQFQRQMSEFAAKAQKDSTNQQQQPKKKN